MLPRQGCGGSSVLSQHAGEGKLSNPGLLGELSFPHMGFAFPESRVLPQSWHLSSGHALGSLGPSIHSRPPRGARINPTFSQESLAASGSLLRHSLCCAWGPPCPVLSPLLSQGTHCPEPTPGARTAAPEDVRGGQATLPSLWLCSCGGHECPDQWLLPQGSSSAPGTPEPLPGGNSCWSRRGGKGKWHKELPFFLL